MQRWLLMASKGQILAAIDTLAGVEGVLFDARSLAEDVVGMAAAFPSPEDLDAAVAATARMLTLLVEGRVDASTLADDYEGWECCHYQYRVGQGVRATMRIMFSRAQDDIRVRGFGDRRLPAEFYFRMVKVGRLDQGR